ncbi:MAG TPA: phosphoglucosamine mutase [Bacilli bacterium]|nr:phosphoglucosamine mutase [Bacilli bacterium]
MQSKYFGTDGIRGLVNEQLTVDMAYRIGRYIGCSSKSQPRRIVIGRDTRVSGQLLFSALVTGIIASGSWVYDMGITTTPSISYITHKHHFDFGIMISASHNPYYDNGIKIFSHEGEKISSALECQIDEYIDRCDDDLPFARNEKIGIVIDGLYLVNEYLDFLIDKAHNFSKLRVLVDCANGSASKLAPILFARIGIQTDFINNIPNGQNINDFCGSTHISTLQEAMRAKKYDIGFSFDGDADRLLAVAPNGQVVDGDALIYIAARSLRARDKLNQNTVVMTVMSNYGTKKSLIDQGFAIEETDVGDKYVQSLLKQKHLSLGGEQSGHIIFMDDLNTGDGLLTAVKILKVMCSENKSLLELLEGLEYYPQKLINVKVFNKNAVMANEGLQSIIEEENKKLKGKGRVLVRPSGTEQLIRVMAETPSIEETARVVEHIANYINGLDY